MLGIIGGIGPLAGLGFQRLLIELRGASIDQEHIPYIYISEPRIPDRTMSLAHDDGREFARAIITAAHRLVAAGATYIVLACNTAHARLKEIQQEVSVPIVDMIALTFEDHSFSEEKRVLVLATTGTMAARVYQSRAPSNLELVFLDESEQEHIHTFIYKTKRNGKNFDAVNELRVLLREYVKKYAPEIVILGCTELSLYKDDLAALPRVIIDPIEILVKHCIAIHQDSNMTLS